jgi:hypothetical protein
MNLSDLHDMIDVDMAVDSTELSQEAVKNPSLYAKYLRLWSDENLKLEASLIKLDSLIQKKRNYYSGNGTPEEYRKKPFDLKIKTDAGIQKYINGDEDVCAFKQKIIIQEQKVKILEKVLGQIKDRQFSIKNAIDCMKFLEGY